MKNRIIIVLATASCWLSAMGQTVVWQMKPNADADYQSIERVKENLYKVRSNKLLGLIDASGKEVAPLINNQITGFYEHKALLTSFDDKGEIINGYLTDDGVYNSLGSKYYTLTGQNFFSDGLLSVRDEQGRVGYIDDKGYAVLGFDDKYNLIKPFVEGYAAVRAANGKYQLINKKGTRMYIELPRVADVAVITSVYQGKAYIVDSYGRTYTYDVHTKEKCAKAKVPDKSSFDYLSRFSCITGKNKEIPFTKQISTGSVGLSPNKDDDGRYGYADGDNIILPCQLSSATSFIDDLAVVEKNDHKGILRYVDNGSFSAIAVSPKLTYDKKPQTCKFTLSVPDVWKNSTMTVMVKGDNTEYKATKSVGKNDEYSFTVTPAKAGNADYQLSVSCDDLLLYETSVTYSFIASKNNDDPNPRPIPQKRCSICKRLIDSTKKGNDYCPNNGAHKTCSYCGKVIDKTHTFSDRCPDDGVPY